MNFYLQVGIARKFITPVTVTDDSSVTWRRYFSTGMNRNYRRSPSGSRSRSADKKSSNNQSNRNHDRSRSRDRSKDRDNDVTVVRKESRWSSGNDRREEVQRNERTDRGSYGNAPTQGNNNNGRESNNNRGRQGGSASDIFVEGSVYKGMKAQ